MKRNNKQSYIIPNVEVLYLPDRDKVICESFGNDYAGYQKFDYGALFGSSNN